MPIQLFLASAGSGKTYNLAKFYLKIALANESNFKQIIAITFTNAAVNEMKERILKYLYELSKGEGDKTLKSELKQSLKLTESELQFRAKNVLNLIVQNYSHFSVSTIDSFIQRLFKVALYELNIRYNYDLVVNNTELIDQSIDTFLFNLEENSEALQWLKQFIEFQIDSDRTADYHKQLSDLANEINKEFFYQFEEHFNSLNDGDFKQLIPALSDIQKNFVKQLKSYHADFMQLLQKSGLSEDSFSYGKSGVGGFLGKKMQEFKKGFNISHFKTNSYILKALENTDSWIAKTKTKEQQLFTPFANEFQTLLIALFNFISKEGKQYQAALTLERNLFNIAIISYISKNLKSFKVDNNAVLLSDIAKILKEFIKENYLFIYEKIGVRYQYFLIDEFQDTSRIQYDVVKPLIEESISKTEAPSVLIVGDVKQAVYRWRNGDWTLMQTDVQKDFNGSIQHIPLKDNWRSLPLIINFNNALIKNLPKSDEAATIYNDIEQHFPEVKAGQDFEGYIKTVLFEKSKKKKEEDAETDDITESISKNDWIIPEIEHLWKKGMKNIGILVRKNKEASELFKLLLTKLDIKDEDFNIISKESISYKNSTAVSLMVNIIKYLHQPTDYLKYICGYYYSKLTNNKRMDFTQVFDEFFNNSAEIIRCREYPLFEKASELVFTLKNVIPENEQVFIEHFLQMIKNYIAKNPSNDTAFIDWYMEKGQEESLKISGQKTGVHILTIHKSKGLEFDAVIIPNINWTKPNNSMANYQWFSKPTGISFGTKVPAFLIKTNKELENSLFGDEYLEEKNKQEIDDLNLLYVAVTRARNVLIMGVYKSEIGEKVHQLFDAGFDLTLNGKETSITHYKKETGDENVRCYEIGNMDTYTPVSQKTTSATFHFSNDYRLFDYNLVVNENQTLSSQKSIAHGNLIHEILAEINDWNLWKNAMNHVFTEFNSSKEEQLEIQESLEKLFAQMPVVKSWFTEAKQIMSERTIFSKGKMYRPDKIFIFDDKTILVDFKTGSTSLESYRNQLLNYKQMLKHMNYPEIESYLLNIDTHEMLKV
jgi:ATP-dependent exoDNAse (exonuclease V) beta subunit